MQCSKCGVEVHPERAELGFSTCVDCSDAKPKRGFMVYGPKTAGALQILPDDPESQRIAERAHRRER